MMSCINLIAMMVTIKRYDTRNCNKYAVYTCVKLKNSVVIKVKWNKKSKLLQVCLV